MSSNSTPYYFVPSPSKYPVLASIGLLGFGGGMSAWVNNLSWGGPLVLGAVIYILVVLYGWFGDAISEGNTGKNGVNVDISYRWSMSWFIFSEIMFFAAFFSALFYARSITVPWLGDVDNKILWPDFVAAWPTLGPTGLVEKFSTIGPWPIPTINTLLLLSSGVTVTYAHHALREGHRQQAIYGLFATVLLGVIFLGVHSCLFGFKSQVKLWYLRLHIFYVDRFSWIPCISRWSDAGYYLASFNPWRFLSR